MCRRRDECFAAPCAQGVCVKEICGNIECEMKSRNHTAARCVSIQPTGPTKIQLVGQTNSYYHKQLMQEAAMKFSIPAGVDLDVAVTVGD